MKTCISLLLASVAAAQPLPQSVKLASAAPGPVTAASASVVGSGGFSVYYYWIVANYGSGSAYPVAAVPAPNAPATLNGSNYVALAWSTPANPPVSYDVLRTATPTFPAGTSCTCAVTIGTTATSVLDQGSALSAYTMPSAAAPSLAEIFLDSIRYSPARLRAVVDGTVVELSAVSRNLTTICSVPYVLGTGTLGQDSNICWDAVNHRLGLGASTPTYSLEIGNGAAAVPARIRLNDNSDNQHIMFANSNADRWKIGQGNAGLYFTSQSSSLGRYFAFGGGTVNNGDPANAIARVSGTWNDGSNVYNGLVVDITNTASGAGSSILDARLNGVSRFQVQQNVTQAYDQTVTIGNTNRVTRAGAGQGSTHLDDWQNNAGTVVAWMDQNGDLKRRYEVVAVGTVASAATVATSGHITHITGTTTISTLTAPANFAGAGGCVVLIPDGLWATNTAGNIALATTAVVNKALHMCYDAGTTKWYPSY